MSTVFATCFRFSSDLVAYMKTSETYTRNLKTGDFPSSVFLLFCFSCFEVIYHCTFWIFRFTCFTLFILYVLRYLIEYIYNVSFVKQTGMIRTSFHLIGACYRDICTMVVIRRVARVCLQQLRFLISRQVCSDHWSLTLGSQHNPHLLLSAGAPGRCRSINGTRRPQLSIYIYCLRQRSAANQRRVAAAVDPRTDRGADGRMDGHSTIT